MGIYNFFCMLFSAEPILFVLFPVLAVIVILSALAISEEKKANKEKELKEILKRVQIHSIVVRKTSKRISKNILTFKLR